MSSDQTRTELRKSILRDALSLHLSSQIKAAQLLFIDPGREAVADRISPRAASVLEGVPCRVCALGALTYALFQQNGEARERLQDLLQDPAPYPYTSAAVYQEVDGLLDPASLLGAFSRSELREMEHAFEGGRSAGLVTPGPNDTTRKVAAQEWYLAFQEKGTSHLLQQILLNALDNGAFDPTDLRERPLPPELLDKTSAERVP